jgi:hypothetical protein
MVPLWVLIVAVLAVLALAIGLHIKTAFGRAQRRFDKLLARELAPPRLDTARHSRIDGQ